MKIALQSQTSRVRMRNSGRRDARIEPSTKRLPERDARLCTGLSATAALGWARTPTSLGPERVSVRILDVRPVQTSGAGCAT
jgi:hypothetical protein